MGGAGGGEGVAGGTDLVARMERSAIRDLAQQPPAPDFAALHPGYEVSPHGWNRKFPLAEPPEHSYTAKIALMASFP